jgi:hypothetical protein
LVHRLHLPKISAYFVEPYGWYRMIGHGMEVIPQACQCSHMDRMMRL